MLKILFSKTDLFELRYGLCLYLFFPHHNSCSGALACHKQQLFFNLPSNLWYVNGLLFSFYCQIYQFSTFFFLFMDPKTIFLLWFWRSSNILILWDCLKMHCFWILEVGFWRNWFFFFWCVMVGDVCQRTECGKGTCKPSNDSTFGFVCECEVGWKQARPDHDDDFKFLPCVIPNCEYLLRCLLLALSCLCSCLILLHCLTGLLYF